MKIASEKILEESKKRVEENSLWYILLLALFLRLPFIYVNNDGRIYGLWLSYFIDTLRIPYPDHPPLFFILSGTSTYLMEIIRSTYPLSLIVFAAGIVILWHRIERPEIALLGTVITSYIFVVGIGGSFYEAAALPSLLSSIGSVYIVYRLADYLYNRKIAVLSAFFLSLSWWSIVYSRVLLVDGFAAFLVLWSIYEYVRYMDGETQFYRSTLLLAAAFYTKYYTLILAPAIGLYALTRSRDWRDIGRWAVPGIIAGLLFLPWLVSTDFYLFNHFASTHYLLAELPSLAGFLHSYWRLLTPLGLGLVLVSVTRHRKLGPLPYLVFGVPLLFYGTTTYLELASHSLINQSNYMLLALPFLIIMMAAGWIGMFGEEIESGNRTLTLAVTAVGLALLLPILVQTSISLEYDENYEVYRGNLNMVNPGEVRKVSADAPTIHFVYSFERHPTLSRVDAKDYHFRWMNPARARILSDRPKNVTLIFNVERLKDSSSPLVIYSGNQSFERNFTDSTEIVLPLSLDRGFNGLRIEQDAGTPWNTSFSITR
ncbi:MAG: glycosyltransferase family 39 protein [Candidatus Nanohaloarchaeota archaeon QJJ-7]|nr:glycosyltransferase family 39 protein [Candidatus Nanohaloarchaeota archaeon QJJ-7]